MPKLGSSSNIDPLKGILKIQEDQDQPEEGILESTNTNIGSLGDSPDPSYTTVAPRPALPTNSSHGICRSKFANSKWKQEKYGGVRPQYRLTTLWPLFLVFSVVLGGCSLGMRLATRNYQTLELDYTDCLNEANKTCSSDVIRNLANPNLTSCICHFKFKLPFDLMSPVLLNYELTGFYQMVRRYTQSRDDEQLKGNIYHKVNLKTDYCDTFAYVGKKRIYPCGKIANSMFTDDIQLKTDSGSLIKLKQSIAPDVDKLDGKFKRPKQKRTDSKFEQNFIKPESWSLEYWDEFWAKGGVEGDDFIFWMRTATFSKFEKPYRILSSYNQACGSGYQGLCKGNYALHIKYRFDTASFGGRKKAVLKSEQSPIDESSFLALTFLGTSIVCMVIAIPSCVLAFSNSRNKVNDVHNEDALFLHNSSSSADDGSDPNNPEKPAYENTVTLQIVRDAIEGVKPGVPIVFDGFE